MASSPERVDTVATGDKRLGALEETSSMASRIPSEALWVAFLNSLIPWPRPLASSGSFFGAEQNQDDSQDQNDFSAAEIEKC